MEEGRCAFKNLTGEPTRKRLLRRPRRRWDDDIRMTLKKKYLLVYEELGLFWLRIGIIGEPL